MKIEQLSKALGELHTIEYIIHFGWRNIETAGANNITATKSSDGNILLINRRSARDTLPRCSREADSQSGGDVG
jgi:hypothetical protein